MTAAEMLALLRAARDAAEDAGRRRDRAVADAMRQRSRHGLTPAEIALHSGVSRATAYRLADPGYARRSGGRTAP